MILSFGYYYIPFPFRLRAFPEVASPYFLDLAETCMPMGPIPLAADHDIPWARLIVFLELHPSTSLHFLGLHFIPPSASLHRLFVTLSVYFFSSLSSSIHHSTSHPTAGSLPRSSIKPTLLQPVYFPCTSYLLYQVGLRLLLSTGQQSCIPDMSASFDWPTQLPRYISLTGSFTSISRPQG
jgi:hypothetical protein